MVDQEPNAQVERELTQQELALSWLEYRESEVWKAQAKAEEDLKFALTYKPTRPGPRPDAEAGGSDHTDWMIANAEYREWPQRQQEEIRELEDIIDFRTYAELNYIGYEQDQIKEGADEAAILIEEYSELERQRRQKEAARKQEEEAWDATKTGKEMDGAHNVENQLKEIVGMARLERVPRHKEGNNGWRFIHHTAKEEGDNREWFNFHRHSPYGQITIVSGFDDGLRVEVVDFSNPQKTEQKPKSDFGDSMSFTVKDGKVFEYQRGKQERSYEYGYATYIGSKRSPVFEQEDMDKVRKLTTSLSSDMQLAAQQRNY